MNAKLIIQARIIDLQNDLSKVVAELQEMKSKPVTEVWGALDVKTKEVLTLKAGLAELKNVLDKLD